MMANPVLLQMKYARIVDAFSHKTGISAQESLDLFYHSSTHELIREGVSDLHCMSDDYLAEMLADEMQLSVEERARRLKAIEETEKSLSPTR